MASFFKVGDLIEARYMNKEAYYPGKIAKIIEKDDGEKLYNIEYDDGDKEEKVEISRILGKGVSEVVWNRILSAFQKASARGVSVGKVLREYIGTEFCVIVQFIKALKDLEQNEADDFDENVVRQVLRQHGCLDGLGEVVLYNKLQSNPQLKDFVEAVKEKHSAAPKGADSPTSKSVGMADVERAFNLHGPVSIVNVGKAVLPLVKTKKELSPEDKDAIKQYFNKNKLGPRVKLTLTQFKEVCGLIVEGLDNVRLTSPTSSSALEKAEQNIRALVKVSHDHGVDCRELFESFDEDFDGAITFNELINGLHQLGVNVEEATIRDLIRKRSPSTQNGDTIQFRQFLSVIAPDHWEIKVKTIGNEKALAAKTKLTQLIHRAQEKGTSIHDAFAHFDVDGNGTLDRREFQQGLSKLGIKLEKDEIRVLMRMFESNDSYEISYADFCNEMLKNEAASASPKGERSQKLYEDIEKTMQVAYGKYKTDWVDLFEKMDQRLDGFLPLEVVADCLQDYGMDFGGHYGKLRACLKSHECMENDSEVNYRTLICKLCPDCWLNSEHSQVDHAQVVAETLDMLCDLIEQAQTRGVSIEVSFKHFDADMNGDISLKELQNGLKHLGLELSTKEARILLKHFSSSTSGNSVSLDEFKRTISTRCALRKGLLTLLVGAREKGLDIEKAMGTFDIDETGVITLDEFCVALSQLGIHKSCEELHGIVEAKYFTRTGGAILYSKFLCDLLGAKHFSRGFSLRATSTPHVVVRNQICSPISTTSSRVMDKELQKVAIRLRDLVHTASRNNVSLKESFKHFDVNGDGYITAQEFDDGLAKLGIAITRHESQLLVRRLGNDKNEISLNQFYKFINGNGNQADEENDPNKATVNRNKLLNRLRTLIRDAQKRGIDHRACFEHFDKDYSGTIDVDEFRTGIQRLGFNITDYEAQALVDDFGVNNGHNSNTISYANFLRLVGVEEERMHITALLKKIQLGLARVYCEKLNKANPSVTSPLPSRNKSFVVQPQVDKSSLRTALNEFDLNRDGIISRTDFLAVLSELDLHLSEADIHVLLRRLDANGDGVIDAQEFVDIVEPPGRVTLHLRSAASKLFSTGASALQKGKTRMLRELIAKRQVIDPFLHFDFHQIGRITKREFRCCLSALGITHLSNHELDVLGDTLDLHENGKVHYEQFVKFLERSYKKLPSWHKKDKSKTTKDSHNDDNKVSDPLEHLEKELEEFMSMAEKLNIPLKETFKHFDKNQDGTVTWEEFHSAMVELGFEAQEVYLRKLMNRIRSFQTNYNDETDVLEETNSANAKIDYNVFLAYWTSLREKKVDRRTEKEIKQNVKRLHKELKEFLVDSAKRGVKASEVFGHFDQNNDGVVTVAEFECAIKDIFADDTRFDERVINKFMEEFDESKDGKIDYYEFLGLKGKDDDGSSVKKDKNNATWQAVFGVRRFQKQRLSAVSVVQSILQSVIRNCEKEISTKGEIWQQVRRNVASRVNNATFIQRNKASAANKAFCVKSSRGPEVADLSDATTCNAAMEPGKKKSLAKRIEIAERLHVAEMAASKMTYEAGLRAEEQAHRERLDGLRDEAVRYGIDKLESVFFFTSRANAVAFLNSIGLMRFESKIIATGHYKNLENCYMFPLLSDQDMQEVLGTCSTIVARKVRRELLNILSVEDLLNSRKDWLYCDVDPVHWNVAQCADFAALCGLNSDLFREYDIDGEALLEMEVHEAIHELGFDNELGVQVLLFRIAYLHHISRSNVFRCSSSDGKESKDQDTLKRHVYQETENSNVIYHSLRLHEKVIPRPSSLPIVEWTVADVLSLAQSLDLPTVELDKLAVDGATLVELTDTDLATELNFTGALLKRFRSAIEAVRQPSFVSLGTGPYFETRLNSDNFLCSNDNVTYLQQNRENDVWVHVGPALTKSFDIAQRALLEEEEKSQEEKQRLKKRKKCANGEPVKAIYDRSQVNAEESRLVKFVAQSVRAGLPVLETLAKYDSQLQKKGGAQATKAFLSKEQQETGFISYFELEKSLLELGYVIPDYGLFRLMTREKLDTRQQSRLYYNDFYVDCLNRAEHHTVTFDRDGSEKSIAFTTDGLNVSLLIRNVEDDEEEEEDERLRSNRRRLLNRKVLCRYGGGSTKYEAVVVAEGSASTGSSRTFDVQYVDSGEVETVPMEWIVLDADSKPAKPKMKKKTSRRYRLASCHEKFVSGVHVYMLKVKHLNSDVCVGVSSLSKTTECKKTKLNEDVDDNGKRFVGLNSSGELVFRNYDESREEIIRRLSSSNKRGFTSGDMLKVRVDLDANEMKIYNVSEKGDEEELCYVRLDEIFRTNETRRLVEIKDFLLDHIDELETIFHDRRTLSLSMVMSELLENVGLDTLDVSETELLAFVQPFLNKSKHLVSVHSLLENIRMNNQWKLANQDVTEVVEYSPSVMLNGTGDCVQSIGMGCTNKALTSSGAALFESGDVVQVRYSGGATFYQAKILEVVKPNKLRDDGVVYYNVEYEDGDEEFNVPEVNIRASTKEEKKQMAEPKDRLLLRVFARVLCYSNEAALAASERRRDGKNIGMKKKKVMVSVENAGSSFSNVSGVRLQELLRRRLNEPDRVNYSTTINCKHSFFTPVALEQAASKQYQIKQGDTLSMEEEWTLIGSVSAEDHPSIVCGDQGIPFTLRLGGQGEPEAYCRLVVMGILGRVNTGGKFMPIEVPIEPVKSCMEKCLKNGREYDIFSSLAKDSKTQHRASRFFLNSRAISSATSVPQAKGYFEVEEEKRSSVERKRIKKKTPTSNKSFMKPKRSMLVHKKKHDHDYSSSEVGRLRMEKLREKSPNHQWQKSPKKTTTAVKKSSNNAVSLEVVPGSTTLSKDERIVLDRWLALVGLNEFGEPFNANGTYVRPELANRSRYEYVLSIHPTKPWLVFSRDHGWLPSKEEHAKIRKWVRREKKVKPNRFSPTQTLYEALVQLHPAKPWLDGRAGGRNTIITGNPRQPSKRSPNTSPKFQQKRKVFDNKHARKKKEIEERQLRQEIDLSMKNVEKNLNAIDSDFEKIAKTKLEQELIEKHGNVDENTEDIKKAARLLAHDFKEHANLQAQLMWEKEEQMRRLKSLDAQEKMLESREREVNKLEQKLRKDADEQNWASRVSKSYSLSNSDDDPFVSAVKKKKGRCPI